MRVLLTRPEGRNDELARRLNEHGHVPVICPLIEVESLGDEPIDLSGYDWLVVTSATGAREIRRRGRGRAGRTAAIGPATAEALGGADLVPAVSTQEGLLAELPRPPGRVLFAGAEGARRLLVEELEADFVATYRSRAIQPHQSVDAELAVLASPSAARSLASLGLELPAVSIGPETTAAAAQAGVRVLAEARSQSDEGLLDAVQRATR